MDTSLLREISVAIVIAAILFMLPILKFGPRQTSTIESIQGIPYPQTPNHYTITQNLAHLDIYLKEPVFAKQLDLTITFVPQDIQRLDVGARRNGFWLSYDRLNLFTGNERSHTEPVTKTLTIPLTNKFQEPDRSIDLMFFADQTGEQDLTLGLSDRTQWDLIDLQASVKPAVPSTLSTLDYLISLARRERAL